MVDLFSNGEAVQLFHVPAATSDGDTIVFFRRSDVVSTGAIFDTTRYPRFDPERGGSIAGVIEGAESVLDLAVAGENQEGGTVVIPGRGRLSDETDVANYRDMVTIIRDRVRAMVAKGLSLEQVKRGRPTMDYDGLYESAERLDERSCSSTPSIAISAGRAMMNPHACGVALRATLVRWRVIATAMSGRRDKVAARITARAKAL